MKNEVFKKGYFYKFKDGRALYAIDICHCERCKSRGLYEPKVVWLDDCSNGWCTDYLTEGYYNELAKDIVFETYYRGEWADKYIIKTVNDNKNKLLREIEEYINSNEIKSEF